MRLLACIVVFGCSASPLAAPMKLEARKIVPEEGHVAMPHPPMATHGAEHFAATPGTELDLIQQNVLFDRPGIVHGPLGIGVTVGDRVDVVLSNDTSVVLVGGALVLEVEDHATLQIPDASAALLSTPWDTTLVLHTPCDCVYFFPDPPKTREPVSSLRMHES